MIQVEGKPYTLTLVYSEEEVHTPPPSAIVHFPENGKSPRQQLELADIFTRQALTSPVGLVVQTWSELLLRRMQRRIQPTELDRSFFEVAFTYLDSRDIHRVHLDPDGDLMSPFPYFEEVFDELFGEALPTLFDFTPPAIHGEGQ